ncbi:MAG TPA: 6-phosphogluconolactonase, partial [Anaerolineae bacterium]|nr:6-phosphogluconolactonase [Anaerolineae bacterium]
MIDGLTTMPNLTIYLDKEAFIAGAAEFMVERAVEALAQRGRWTVALAGGGTPQPIYARLAEAGSAQRIDWSRVHVFFGDERCLPPDDPLSNYRMAREALLDFVPLPPDNVHRIRGEDDPALAALAYEQTIQRLFRTMAPPAFDLICLGMGDNGHTASLFPGTAALREQARWVVPQYVEVMQTWRVTMTAPLLNAARHAAFFVEGAGKADMLQRVLHGPYDPDVLPAQMIQPTGGQLHWLVDAATAGRLAVNSDYSTVP